MNKALILLFTSLLLLSACNSKPGQVKENINSGKELQNYLLSDWNTWHNPNLLTHVLMPEGLSISLNFRTTYRDEGPSYLDQTYISGLSPEESGQIIPIVHTYDGRYTELIINWKGLKARVQTATYNEELFILYTPLEIPEYPPIMIIEAGMLYNREGNVQTKTNLIQADLGPDTYNLSATQPDSMLNLSLTSPYMSFNSSVQTGFYTGRKRTLDFLRRFINDRKELVSQRKESYGQMADVYEAQRSLLAWNTIHDAFNNRLITPVSRRRNETWGGWVLNGNSSYFTSSIFALDNKYLAFANAMAITSEITVEGYLPSSSGALSNGRVTARSSQPPVGSLICNLIYQKYPEKWFLEEVYDNLLAWNRWWESNRSNQGYLSWGSNPSPAMTPSESRSLAINESGSDTPAYFSEAKFNEKSKLFELASVDLLSLYVADCKNLAEIALVLGKTDDQKELLQRAQKYAEKLQSLWDDNSGIFRDKDLTDSTFYDHTSVKNFYALLSGIPTAEQAERMINEHLLNPAAFSGEFMIPSLPAKTDRKKLIPNPDAIINTQANFLVYLGLLNYELPEARKMLAEKSLKLFLKEWTANTKAYDNYHAITGTGIDAKGNNDYSTNAGLLSLIALMEAGYWQNPAAN
jgi:putative isomerase